MRVSPDKGVFVELTERQAEIIELYADGLATKTIAHCLRISPKTVEYHRTRIYAKTKVNNLIRLTKWAIRAGLTGLACLALTSAAAPPLTPLVLVWDNPGPQYTNLIFRIYQSTNVTLPMNQWSVTLPTNIVQINGGAQLAWTNSYPYNTWFFAATWSNAMWHTESPFSNVAAPDLLPPATLPFNLRLIGVP